MHAADQPASRGDGRRQRDSHPQAAAEPRGRRGPSFWLELYWFAFILIVGGALALAVLPPKLLALRESLTFESRCRERLRRLDEDELALRKSLAALERGEDLFFREEAIRIILRIKGEGEEYAPPAAQRQ